MITLFARTLIIYLFTFIIVRLMGKRQISDMQPFDLVITLLIADLAAMPISDSSTPLLHGLVPVIALFVLHRIVSYASLKSEKLRRLVCGSPLVVIAHGIVSEDVMRSANYSFTDLMEQLRIKDVFSISQVEFAILETNGSLSVLLKGPFQTPTNEALSLQSEAARPQLMLVMDGKIHDAALKKSSITKNELLNYIKSMGYKSPKECLFISLDASGILHAQDKQKAGKTPQVHFIKVNQ